MSPHELCRGKQSVPFPPPQVEELQSCQEGPSSAVPCRDLRALHADRRPASAATQTHVCTCTYVLVCKCVCTCV